MFAAIRRFFAPEPHIPRLPDAEVKRKYPKMRWRVLEATFVGYALYYLVRNNISVVSKDMEINLGYTKEMIGDIIGISAVAYGLGKFLMGAVSDRSNPRVFIAFGLLATSAMNFAFGAAGSYHLHLILWAANGFVQGMGWPPCGRSMGHWYSEGERGLTFSIWNTSHNVGGAIAGVLAAWAVGTFGGWEYAFYVPGAITAVMSIYLFLRLVDTPQSQGLPPIEEHRNDFTRDETEHGLHERELTFRELFLDYVIYNKFVWILAVANFFAYISRYAMLDWGPTYLREVKNTDIEGGGWAVAAIELGGIPSTIALGYLSDRLGGRRGMVAVLCMIPIIIAFALLPFVPPGAMWIDLILLFIIGLMIYPVINFITIMALDLTSKKAIGVAAGFIGLFGYVGRMVYVKGAGWSLDKYTPTLGLEKAWSIPLGAAMGASIIAMGCLLLTWNTKPKA
jgi:OPA family glycerol-3-phosphate transporter-like MFS transporter